MSKILLTVCFILIANLPWSARAASCREGDEDSLKLMTLNAQINTSRFQVGPWKIRAQLIADVIRTHHVAALQEVLNPMREDLIALLPEYSQISVGRDDGKLAGEHVTIFYDRERLELMETRTFWLSQTPDVPGSVGWDAWSPRIVTWIQFKDRHSGKIFFVFNTHLDHWGEEAQVEGAKLLALVSSLKAGDSPRIVLGDFNSKPQGAVYQTFLSASGLQDAMAKGPHSGPTWTYSFFGTMKAKIDYAFVSSQVEVCSHAILPDDPQQASRRSDHLPISIRANL